jgi:hypothetical protein
MLSPSPLDEVAAEGKHLTVKLSHNAYNFEYHGGQLASKLPRFRD